MTKRVYKKFSMADVAMVREKYPEQTASEIAARMGRSESSLRWLISDHGIMKQKDYEFIHAQFKIERVLKLMNWLRSKRLKITTIADELSISERTAYRYIALLMSLDVKISKLGRTYKIEDSKCPFCGHEHTTNNTL